ncbi:MAG: SIMPL domain-containing protein [Egibacteraceae bacterium]
MRRWSLSLPLLAIVLAACTGRVANLPSASAASDSAALEGVTVNGLGRVMGSPDVLRATVGVSVTRPTVQEALDAANAAADALLEALRDQGVSGEDVGTRDFGVNPELGYPENSLPQITGYTVRNTVEAKLRDLGRVGEVLTAAVRAGGDAARVEGIGFMLDDNAALLQQARDAAFADARTKAEQYARLADRPLGALVSVSEVTAVPPPIPFEGRAGVEDAQSAPVPIAPGQQEVTVTVTARWTLG